VEKGSQADAKNLTVLYSESRDEMWIDSPKLKPGTAVILVLQWKQKEKGMPAARWPGWTALDPLDVQPVSAIDRVRLLIKNPQLPPGEEKKR